MYKKIMFLLSFVLIYLSFMASILNAQKSPRFNGNRGEEVHLFILWENAIKDEVNCQKIENDIEQSFEILGKYKINWSKNKIENNFMRFYNQGEKFTKVESVKKGCNTFLLIVVNVKDPKYDKRTLLNGSEEIVCTNVFDKKYEYRITYLQGKYTTIHSTVTSSEADHDLTLLLGVSAEDFKANNKKPWDGKTIELNQDLFGAYGWNNLNDLFYTLNHCSNYVVLKKFSHVGLSDVDLLCDFLRNTTYAANAVRFVGKNGLFYYKVKVENKYLIFDIKSVDKHITIEDGLKDESLYERTLNKKIFNGVYFVPGDNEYYFVSMVNNFKEFFKYQWLILRGLWQ